MDKKISIISFNVQGFPLVSLDTYNRLSKIGSSLNSSNADIINLQEVHTYFHFLIFKKKLMKFPYFSFEKFLFGPKGGVVTFSKFPIENINYTPFVLRSAFTIRIFLSRGVLVSKLKSFPFLILNTHLTANTDNDWSPNNRFFNVHETELANLKKNS